MKFDTRYSHLMEAPSIAKALTYESMSDAVLFNLYDEFTGISNMDGYSLDAKIALANNKASLELACRLRGLVP